MNGEDREGEDSKQRCLGIVKKSEQTRIECGRDVLFIFA
jgi:hypothetical protein